MLASLVSLAASQHGVLTVAQLRAAGLTGSVVSKRVRRGELHRLHHGVYALGHPALSREGVWLAAVFAGGPGAVLSHLSATALLVVLDRFRLGPPDVLVPSNSHRRVEGVRFRKCTSLDPRDVTVANGIPVTTVARLLVDLTDLLTPHQLVYVIKQAAYRKRLDLAATRRAMERANGRRNLTALTRAIDLYLNGSAGTKSPHEDAFLALWGARRPEPLVNTQLAGFEVDFLWPESMLVVEIDGGGHGRPTAQRKDALEDRVLRGAGYTVLRFTDIDLERRPTDVIDRVTAGVGDVEVHSGP
ncbi:type IV toxin-antitoxin system AbiEi family antitoxin domain-containing protein [Solirubrobacter soli]|uniref:type IV toxin-antitoxin system AbiEi family antitoxin domain-containing protein n=1 Tax=Solirubrobacter soli TaxID=363832 RepID=UPI00048910BC|nr:type IV toxin-antitoxin system AbiEi family antitoxin domain-containing protein [Solirubrobacter soli]